MLTVRRATIALLGWVLAVPVQAAPTDTDAETVIVRVARPVSHSPAAMRRLDRRLAAAALDACGASAFSAPGVQDAVLRSACWRQSYADAIAQVGGSNHGRALAIEPAHGEGRP
jgi:UrcA family protein